MKKSTEDAIWAAFVCVTIVFMLSVVTMCWWTFWQSAGNHEAVTVLSREVEAIQAVLVDRNMAVSRTGEHEDDQ